MHRIATFIIAAFIVGFIADTSSAQIGRGRLLKKFRDDLFGTPNDSFHQAQEAAAREAQLKLEAARKAQLENQKRLANSRQPTPIGTGKKQTAQQPPSQRAQQSPHQRPTPTQTRQQPRQNVANPNQKPKKGFGFQLVEKERKLFVAKVDPTGNAASKGIRRGDVITGIGGVQIDGTDAFDEIVEILTDGDSIEIAIQRGGKSDEIQVSYGETPNTPEAEGEFRGDIEPIAPLPRNRRTADFAPPQQQLSNQSSSRNRHVISPGHTQTPSRGAYNPQGTNTQQLDSVVRQQASQIQALQRELRAYRQQNQNQFQVPTRGVNSVLGN